MTILDVNARKWGATDMALGIGSHYYVQDGVSKTVPRLNASHIEFPVVPGAYVSHIPYKPGYLFDARNYGSGTLTAATLNTAVTALGSTTDAGLVLSPGVWDINADVTAGRKIIFLPQPGAILRITDSKTFTGHVVAGNWQIFDDLNTGYDGVSLPYNEAAPIQWWGATSCVGDCYAMFKCAANALNESAVIKLTPGVWILNTPLALTGVTTSSVCGIVGTDESNTFIWVDVAAASDGITIGMDGDSTYLNRLENFTIAGAASCCRDVLVLQRTHNGFINRVKVFAGGDAYGLAIKGCIGLKGNISVGYGACDFGTCAPGTAARPYGGVKITHATAYQTNVLDLNVAISGNFVGNGIYIDGASSMPCVDVKLSGFIDGVLGSYVLYSEYCNFFDFSSLYMTENTGGAKLIKITNGISGLFNNNHAIGMDVEFVACRNVTIDGGDFDSISIDEDCQGFKIGSFDIVDSGGLSDLGQGTTYFGTVRQTNLVGGDAWASQKPSSGDQVNLLENTDFERWGASGPDLWSDPASCAWTQCGVGLGDTVRHGTTYCALVTSTAAAGAAIAPVLTLDANLYLKCRGHMVSFSAWVYLADGQAPATYPYFRITQTVGGSPVYFYSYTTRPLNATTVDAWTKVHGSFYVDPTATAMALTLYVHSKADGSAVNLYISEISLIVNGGAVDSYTPSPTEVGSYLRIGKNKISYGTAVPASGYCVQGDIVWRTDATTGSHPGWICTTTGTGGGTAVWKAMANVA